MMSMKLEVVTTGGRYPVNITPKVQVEFERHYGVGIAKAFSEDQKIEHIYFLAWKAMHYAGLTASQFDQWLDDVLDVEMTDGDAAPLDKAR